jgi:intracellular sulfur oxidation DsrE/DsrF family protein
VFPALALDGPADFRTGPIIDGFGAAATVPDAAGLPAETQFKVAFDTAKGSDGDALNKTLESAARFLNMHGQTGVPVENIDLAVVIHGGAAFDLLTAAAHKNRRDGAENPNIALIKALMDKDVRIILCGQTAMYRDIGKDDLLPNVELSLSAMTAHAQLHSQGYTLNPF